MKPFISTKFYGVMNYVLALFLISSPWFIPSNAGSSPALWIKPGDAGLAYFHVGGAALFFPTIIGWLQLVMAFFSASKHGVIRQFPMQMHFFLDVITGSFLFASPFVYGFSEKICWPQMLVGALLMIFGIFTQKSPFTTPPPHPQPQGGLTSVDYEESTLMH
jgi:hypothetical protein